jgi:hypothetical protein
MFKKIASALLLASLALSAGVAQADDGHVYKFDKVKWMPAGLEGAEMAVLWGSEAEGNAMWAFRLQPGVAIPAHTHSVDYWGFAIQGKWAHIDSTGNTVVTGQDEYVRIRSANVHADKCMGPEVCINVVQFKGNRDIFFPEVKLAK